MELEKSHNVVTEPNFGNHGQKTRKEKELNLLKGGQSFDANQGDHVPRSKGGESPKLRYDNEGEYFCTLRVTKLGMDKYHSDEIYWCNLFPCISVL